MIQIVEKPDGAHPCGHFDLTCTAVELAKVLSTVINLRGHLSVLLRPVTKHQYRDITGLILMLCFYLIYFVR